MTEAMLLNNPDLALKVIRHIQATRPEDFNKLFSSPEEVLTLKVNGKFTLYDKQGKVKDVREFHNLICTAGKNLLLASGGTAKYVKDYAYVMIGTGTTAANAADTALETELTRALGAVSNPSASVFRVNATFAAGVGTGAITESGLDYQATASGAILNRQVFAAINKGASDSLQAQWEIS